MAVNITEQGLVPASEDNDTFPTLHRPPRGSGEADSRRYLDNSWNGLEDQPRVELAGGVLRDALQEE